MRPSPRGCCVNPFGTAAPESLVALKAHTSNIAQAYRGCGFTRCSSVPSRLKGNPSPSNIGPRSSKLEIVFGHLMPGGNNYLFGGGMLNVNFTAEPTRTRLEIRIPSAAKYLIDPSASQTFPSSPVAQRLADFRVRTCLPQRPFVQRSCPRRGLAASTMPRPHRAVL